MCLSRRLRIATMKMWVVRSKEKYTYCSCDILLTSNAAVVATVWDFSRLKRSRYRSCDDGALNQRRAVAPRRAGSSDACAPEMAVQPPSLLLSLRSLLRIDRAKLKLDMCPAAQERYWKTTNSQRFDRFSRDNHGRKNVRRNDSYSMSMRNLASRNHHIDSRNPTEH